MFRFIYDNKEKTYIKVNAKARMFYFKEDEERYTETPKEIKKEIIKEDEEKTEVKEEIIKEVKKKGRPKKVKKEE